MNRKERSTEKKIKKSGRHQQASTQTLFSTALHHHQAGNLAEAEKLYRQVLEISPFHNDSYNLLGVIALQVGRFDVAVDLISKALTIEPNIALYHSNLGNAWKGLGRFDAALDCYRRALVLQPLYPEAHVNMGVALLDKRQLDEAASAFRKAIELKPDIPEAHNNLGNVLIEQALFEDAIVAYRRALALRPHYPEALNNLSTALKNIGELDQALHACQKALNIRSDFPEAHNNISIIHKKCGNLDEAVVSSRRAIELSPRLAEAHYNLGIALAAQGKTDDAVLSYRTAIKLKNEFPNAHTNLAMALLARGDWAEGWQEYEWRWKTERLQKFKRPFTQPQWRGEAASGKTLLIHAEQGYGDTLQFCRYAALATKAGLKVILEVQKPLVRLLNQSSSIEIHAFGDDLPTFDLHCPMLSLPLAFQTTLTTIPHQPSYLKAQKEDIKTWETRLKAVPNKGLKIGLAWSGSTTTESHEQRSFAPEQWAPLLKLTDCHFVSLQKDAPTAPSELGMTDFMAEMHDFADTAGLIANLDLVITADTAIVHLAGALGKPVWLIDRFDPDWRWLLGRNDSPWYPSLRIYRQATPGDWCSVMQNITHDLQNKTFAAKKA